MVVWSGLSGLVVSLTGAAIFVRVAAECRLSYQYNRYHCGRSAILAWWQRSHVAEARPCQLCGAVNLVFFDTEGDFIFQDGGQSPEAVVAHEIRNHHLV